MKKISTLLILILFLFLFCQSAEAKNLYVNGSTGSDSTTYANNDAENPWATVLRATWGRSDGNRNGASNSSEAAQAGDTVYVAAGTYEYDHNTYPYSSSQRAIYEFANDGTAGNWIKLEAVGTVNLTTNDIPANYWISGAGAPVIGSYGDNSYVWFDGFTINQQTIKYRRGRGVVNIWGSQVKITNCTLTGTYTNYGESDQHNGILLDGPAPCTTDSNDITISNNTISGFNGAYNENSTGITAYCVGDNYTIEHNEISDCGMGLRGKTAYYDSANIFIRYNLFVNNETSIEMGAFDSWHVYQNIFRDSDFGFRIGCFSEFQGTGKPTNFRLVNNTFDNNTRSIYVEGTCSNMSDNIIQNNIVTNSTYTLTSENSPCYSTGNINSSDLFLDYNLWEYSGVFWYYQDGGSTVEATLGSAQTTYDPVFANGATSVDPLYTNESGNDFTLTGSSPCLEGNANDGVDILDLDGDSSTVDAITLGAYITGDEEIGIESGGGGGSSTKKVSVGGSPIKVSGKRIAVE